MPGVGDQHRAAGDIGANPFDEPKPRMSEYTAQEIATLQSRLDKQLGPEFISARQGPGGKKVHYLAAEKVIGLANEVFGFNGWSSSIRNVQIDFVEENPNTGRVRLGLSVIVRVTLRDGTFHEDIGYGQIENAPGKAAAFEKCKKEGTTDALKRALRNFGNVLGNCIYDKDFLQRVTKIKPEPSRWNADNLHRHTDYAPIKKEAQEEERSRNTNHSGDTSVLAVDDEFGDAFDEADYENSHYGNSDEVVLDAEPSTLKRPRVEEARPITTDTSRAMNLPQTNLTTPSKPSRPPENDRAAHIERQRQIALEKRNAQLAAQRMQPPSNVTASHPQQPRLLPQPQPDNQHQLPSTGVPSQHSIQQPGQYESHLPPVPFDATDDQVPSHAPPVGFYSARAVGPEGGSVAANAAAQFNPHSESPSIRKTAGIDHKKSGKVTRDSLAGKAALESDAKLLPGPGAANVTIAAPARDFVNPSSDMNRRIGLPGSGIASPSMTKSYRPPMKRPTSDATAPPRPGPPGPTRQPLSDVGNVIVAPGPGDAGIGEPDLKKPRNQAGGPPGSDTNCPREVGNGIENAIQGD